MPSKYCPECQKIITTGGSSPNFCYYCCRNLSDMPVLAPIIHYKDRVRLLEKLKKEYKPEPAQLKLFSI